MPKPPPFRAYYERTDCHLNDAQVFAFLTRLFTMLQITSCTLEDINNEISGTPLEKHSDAILHVIAEADDAIADLQPWLEGEKLPDAQTPGSGLPHEEPVAHRPAAPDLPPSAVVVPFFALQAIIDQAGNPATAPAMLIEMAEDPHPTVRLCVAQNPATPLDTLRRLRDGDTHAAVREAAQVTFHRKALGAIGLALGALGAAGPAPAATGGAFIQMRGRWWHPLARWLGFSPKPVCVWKDDPKAMAVLKDAWNKVHGPWPPPKS